MCKNLFGGGDNSALIAAQQQANALQQRQAQQEAEREGRIRQGQSSIDAAFSRYGPDYYDKFRTDFVGAKNPSIDYQYGQAKDKLKAALAGRGIGKSSIAGNAFGDIEAAYAGAREGAANDAFSAADALRNRIETSKTNLYSLNSSAADPSRIAQQAEANATALTPLPASGEVGDIFGSALSPFTNYLKANTYSPYGGQVASTLRGLVGGGNSGKVYN